MAPTLKENVDYFKNRVAFEIPVYDTVQFQAILAKADTSAAYRSVKSLLAETRGLSAVAFELCNFGEWNRLEDIIKKLEKIVDFLN